MDQGFNQHNRMIACRSFNPTSMERATASHLADLLHAWALDCMLEVGIGLEDLFGGTIDHGSDILRAMTHPTNMALPTEWCGPHMCNRVMEEGLGYTEDPDKSHNPDSRKQIMELRGVASHIRSSPITNVRPGAPNIEGRRYVPSSIWCFGGGLIKGRQRLNCSLMQRMGGEHHRLSSKKNSSRSGIRLSS